MIIVQMNGGLGNQLFQYSTAKALSLRKNVPLLLDLSWFHQTGKKDGLHHFSIPDKIASNSELKPFYERGLLTKAVQRIKRTTKREIYREKFFHFDPDLFKVNETVFLKGIWQSEKYFIDHANAIRQILSVKEEYIKQLSALKNEIQSTNSVSIHVRRGDYLTAVALDVLGLQEKDYYMTAWSTIASKVPDAQVYYFSDDPKYVEEELMPIIPGKILSRPEPHNYIEDFYLMSHCKHNIIANSSFSWWAAWLNNYPGKQVIAPKKWFNNGPKDTEDLIPDGWLRI
jgi:hypothetical protein